ncbi:3'(2'),5'-bisphosphate nucleotidase CysQ [Acidocella sp.]|uniref:3'(2'),5'-bisphosphate nucleotidase CysQ n=1 Tax=Acidocella sp. TaxID=50710 RepID=UPI00261962F7|nr:3'(2'),5'-bisphosphate nucleotidase CysQ [Acidocella sp.]
MSNVKMTDLELAKVIAEETGKILLNLREAGLFQGKALGKAGDRVANAFIIEALRENRPDDAILSEEEKDSTARLAAERVWIVDPLDGTREYGEGRADWAVHIALAIGGKPAIGAVALPGLGRVFLSQPQRLPAIATKLRVLVSRTRPGKEALAVAEALGAELVPMGSAGAKAMAVLRGEADIYLHTGGQYEWDNCAPAAVALAAGLHASRVDGSSLAYNNADPYLPDLLICQKELAPKVLALLSKVPA